jgi:hypothetical protein
MPLPPGDPVTKQLVEVLLGRPFTAADRIMSVTLELRPDEMARVVVEHLVDVDTAGEVVATFVEHRLVSVAELEGGAPPSSRRCERQ